MRLVAGLTAAALSGLAATASTRQSADVYIFQASPRTWSEPPSISKEIARHILLQRTSSLRYGSDLRDIPSTIDTQTAVDHIATFGKSPAPLFTQTHKTGAAQLIVILEGTTTEQSSRLKDELGAHAAFTISDPPSATANNHLMALFRSLGVASSQKCELSVTINPFDEDCWAGPASVVRYDLRASPETLDSLFNNLPRINKFVNNGDLELVLVVLPESSRSSKHNDWSAAAALVSGPSDLRRRREAAEAVISDANDDTTVAAGLNAAAASSKRAKSIPQCFTSLSSCKNQTNECSGHGECVNKFAIGNATAAAAGDSPACFVCVCKASIVERGEGGRTKGRKTVQWGGNMCQKEDVSVQFWLIVGFTVAVVGAVTFAIGLLFNVGEEPLPGVIGAGVSRSK
ncbi:hypothetical protein VTK26DRAFT_2595 [Humicola hyalothermophila]